MVRELPSRRPHIYELDPLRICTALGVVAVHVLAFTVYLNHSNIGVQIQNAVVVTTHFTRAVFMFVTAFAMVYVYYGKPFALKQFWVKRSIGVLLPYSIWSIVYTWVNTPAQSPLIFIREAIFNILTGNSSYQMYYILLTLQFYLILPLFLLFLKYVAHHPWRVLAVSFVIQVILFYIDYHTLQEGTLASSGIWQIIAEYQNRFVLIYQFFFIVGGFTALYFPQVRSFLLRHGRIIVYGFILAIAALWLHFFVQVRVYQEPIAYVTSVLQPIMVFYSLTVILFAFWLACRWASDLAQDGRPKGYKTWHVLSDASFGVYLIHALVLTVLLRWVVPVMPTVWPVAFRVFLTWFLTAGSATALSLLLMYIPVFSRLVGRAYSWPRNTKQRQTQESKAEKRSQEAEVVSGSKQTQHAL